MNKRLFVQYCLIRAAPELIRNLPNIEPAVAFIRGAARLWDEGATPEGYGNEKPSEPRDDIKVNWYKELSEYQRTWFDRFWEAFGYKEARGKAAMRWHQLGELSVGEYRRIVEAAKQEKAKPRAEGRERKMAQGWLTERRWEDYAPPASVSGGPPADPRKAKLLSDIAALKQLQNYRPDPKRAEQIAALEAELKGL